MFNIKTKISAGTPDRRLRGNEGSGNQARLRFSTTKVVFPRSGIVKAAVRLHSLYCRCWPKESNRLLGLNYEDSCEFSGVGYFLTLKNPSYPDDRIVMSTPNVTGTLSGIEVGFIAFIQDAEITLECFTHGAELTATHRDGEFIRNSG